MLVLLTGLQQKIHERRRDIFIGRTALVETENLFELIDNDQQIDVILDVRLTNRLDQARRWEREPGLLVERVRGQATFERISTDDSDDGSVEIFGRQMDLDTIGGWLDTLTRDPNQSTLGEDVYTARLPATITLLVEQKSRILEIRSTDGAVLY